MITGNLSHLCVAYSATLFNLGFAAFIYLTLRGWLVPLEQSGMQLMLHLIFTLPVVIGTTIWFRALFQSKIIGPTSWKVNVLALLIPILSMQRGVTHYGYDIAGLIISIFLFTTLLFLFLYSAYSTLRTS